MDSLGRTRRRESQRPWGRDQDGKAQEQQHCHGVTRTAGQLTRAPQEKRCGQRQTLAGERPGRVRGGQSPAPSQDSRPADRRCGRQATDAAPPDGQVYARVSSVGPGPQPCPRLGRGGGLLPPAPALAEPVPSLPVHLAHPPTRGSGTGGVEGESTAPKPSAHSARFGRREQRPSQPSGGH